MKKCCETVATIRLAFSSHRGFKREWQREPSINSGGSGEDSPTRWSNGSISFRHGRCRFVEQFLPNAWGRIIDVCTDGARGFAGEVSNGASNSALERFSRAAATTLGPFGITVNVVSLGPVQTGWIPETFVTASAANIPLRRVSAPDDVADVVLFFASDLARWVTGQTLYLGGCYAV
jgi:NAD(P)-dependent dehydrogenase (short-subunit alcohol dehydrogenase family)